MKKPANERVDVDDFRKRLELLRRTWDRYFQGVERLPPAAMREKFTRELHRARMANDLHGTDRFRLQQVQQRLNSYARLWDRNMRAIEAGTFKRHVAQMERKRAQATALPGDDTFAEYAAICERNQTAPPERSAFLEQLAAKRKNLEAKHGISLRFSVTEKDGKPSLSVIRADAD
jgi:hypothetical protein